MLEIIPGDKKEVNKKLYLLAVKHQPSLFIDCSLCINPHQHEIPPEQLSKVFVVEAESLYRFKPVVESLPKLIEKTKANVIIISSFNTLFAYDDEDENKVVYNNLLQQLSELSKSHRIIIGGGLWVTR